MDYLKTLTHISSENGGIIFSKNAEMYGISRAMLSKMYKSGKLIRISKGQYVLNDELQDEMISIQRRSKNIIFSHDTALFMHGISDRTPFIHTVTAPSDCVPSPALKSVCKVYYVKTDFFELGKTTMRNSFGNMVEVYDLERTMCDVIRSRNKLGTETFYSSLKNYVTSSKKDLNKLSIYAKELRVTDILQKYLEVLL